MATASDSNSGYIPEFHGDVGLYRDWRRSVRTFHAGQKDDQRALTAPRVLARLRGEAWRSTRQRDPGTLRTKGEEGFEELLTILDASYGWQTESILFESCESLLHICPRRAGETITALLARFRASFR